MKGSSKFECGSGKGRRGNHILEEDELINANTAFIFDQVVMFGVGSLYTGRHKIYEMGPTLFYLIYFLKKIVQINMYLYELYIIVYT